MLHDEYRKIRHQAHGDADRYAAPQDLHAWRGYMHRFLPRPDQSSAVMKTAAAGDPPAVKALDDPAALLLAAERGSKRGKKIIRIVINHSVIFTEESEIILGGCAEEGKKKTVPGLYKLMNGPIRIVESLEQKKRPEQLQVRDRPVAFSFENYRVDSLCIYFAVK
jgi:hypothetical protein